MPPKQDNKKLYIIFGAIMYAFILIISFHIGRQMHLQPHLNMFEALTAGLDSFMSNPLDFFPIAKESFSAIGIATMGAAIAVLIVKVNQERNKHSMPGKESGSAKWNTDFDAYNKKYTDPPGSTSKNGNYNMILSRDVFLSMNTRQTLLNNNILIIGGSGSGKSRFFVKPNLLQANCNYVVTDPSGELLESTGKFLESQGYTIKVFNLVEMSKSHCYNPFEYVRNDEDVLTMIDCLITNTTPPNTHGGDQFWVKSETALLQALCFYLINHRPKEEQNFTQVMKLLRMAEIDENNASNKSDLDRIFEKIHIENPESLAYKQYMTFKMGAGRTLKSILISCAVRLTVFNLKQIENLTNRDTIDLASMGDGKKALFLIIPQASQTYNFLAAMLYSQLFETLYFVAQTNGKGTLNTHVRFLLDEFANIGQIPAFDKKLSTMRKYELSCSVILQNMAQIKSLYKDDWATIIGNCDTLIYLGGRECDTSEYLSNMLGTQTIIVRNNSRSRGKNSNSSLSYNRTARKLMTPEEIGGMKNDECLVIIRSLDPFYTKKYEYTKHPNYKFTGDADKERRYILTLNNNLAPDSKDILNQVENQKALRYIQSQQSRELKDKMFSEPMSFRDLLNGYNAKNAVDLFSRFHIKQINIEASEESLKEATTALKTEIDAFINSQENETSKAENIETDKQSDENLATTKQNTDTDKSPKTKEDSISKTMKQTIKDIPKDQLAKIEDELPETDAMGWFYS